MFRRRRTPRTQSLRPCRVMEVLESRVLLAAQLVADVNPADYGSNPAEHTVVNGVTFFSADDGLHGRELWKTDGTEAGTLMVKDIWPGAPSSNPLRFVSLNGALLFAATDGENGIELWRSDGTEAGTTMLADIRPGSGSSNPGASATPRAYLVLDDKMFFSADDGTHGNTLWVTDGTADGTHVVMDVPSGNGPSAPASFVRAGDQLFFVATGGPGVARRQVWKSDGTAGGTVRITGDAAFPFDSTARVFASGNYAYYAAPSAAGGGLSALWRTDGTPGGTVLLKDGTYFLGNYADLNGTLLFQAQGGVNPVELWRTDGTPLGTVKIASRADSFWSYLTSNVSLGGRVVSVVGGTSGPWEIWSTDGTPAGTGPIKTVPATADPGDVPRLTASNGKAYFIADDGSGNKHLWRTDGTAAGTVQVSTAPLATQSGALSVSAAGDWLYPQVRRAVAPDELWRTDGNSDPVLVRNINLAGVGGFPTPGFELKGAFYFIGNGMTLFRTDGTPSGTAPVYTLPGENAPASFARLGNEVYFASRQSGGGQRDSLWKTDGTTQGTVEIRPPELTSVGAVAAFNRRVYFAGYNEATGWQLWSSDGAAATTAMLKNLSSSGFGSSSPASFHVYNGALYFSAPFGPTGGTVLWRTDGTPEGTVRVDPDSIYPNGPRETVDMGGKMYFFAGSPNGTALYQSDGTAAGTLPLQWFLASDNPRDLVVAGNRLFFTTTELSERRLWTSDGTPEGTVNVANRSIFPPIEAISGGRTLVAAGSEVYFQAFDFETGRELWKSDGTPEGTVLVKDILPGEGSSRPALLAAVGGVAFFSADDGVHGRELWRTDGTEAGTVMVEDVDAGERPGDPAAAMSIDSGPLAGTVFFRASSFGTGAELWKTTAAVAQPPRVVGRHVYYNRSSYDGNNAAATAADDQAIATDKQALLPGQTGTFANVTSYSRGLNGIMVDIANLPAGGLSAGDFQLFFAPSGGVIAPAPAPVAVATRPGAGVGGSTRVVLYWNDYVPQSPPTAGQAPGNGWLEVTVNANAHTGLADPDTFYFGNLIGETGNSATALSVNAIDLSRVRAAQLQAAPVTSPLDFNRDGRINAVDLGLCRANQLKSLPLPNVPPAITGIEVSSHPLKRADGRDVLGSDPPGTL